MKNLTMTPLDARDHLLHPEETNEITPTAPAMCIFTDFKQHEPTVIEGNTPAIQADVLMRKSHVRLFLVVDEQNELIGTIGRDELDEQNFIQHLGKGVRREEILVKDLMLRRSDIKALTYRELENSSIADVIQTLQLNHQQHCLVLDDKQHHIRGIISASNIARRLHMQLTIEKEPTFIDICKAAQP